jgi:signal transduction histidine kinase/ActR/RegA family two-component response regulator
MHRPVVDFCSNRLAPFAGWMVVATGLCGLLGWILDNRYLKGLVLGGITIKTNATLSLMALGGGLLLLRPESVGRTRWWLGTACATAALVVGLLTLTQHVTGIDLGIDQMLFSEPPGERATVSPNRMGPPACLSLVAGGIGLLCLGLHRAQAAQLAAILIAMIAAVPITGYAYDIAPLYGISRFTGIALHTAVAFMFFAVGLFVVRPTSGAMGVLTSDYAGGVMARRLLVPALVLPFLIGWIRTLGEQFGIIDAYLGRPVLIILLTLILVGLIFRNARIMSAMEKERLASEREKSAALARHAEAIEQARAAAVEAREQAEQASRAKSDFLATLSHEMRTPLSPVMLTLADMEKHPAFPDALRADLQLVRHNLQLETKLISDLLDLTRIERQKLVLDRTDVDLHQVLRDTVALCATADAPPVTLELQASRHWVNGDDIRLRQVCWNLLDNARKFTPPSGRVTVITDEPSPGQIRIRVIDTGAGITPEMTKRLFHAFEQAPGSNRVQQRGLGLGLSIARRLVEAHGGTITAASAGTGLGSTFTVELPVLDALPVITSRPASPELSDTPPLRILLVEDHPAMLQVMNKLLSNLGHRVSTASTVAGAVALARADSFDVLVSDLGLPDGSGHELVRQIGGHFRGRTIALSGYGSEADVRISHDQGFSVHLTKPVEMDAVLRALRTVTEGAPGAN